MSGSEIEPQVVELSDKRIEVEACAMRLLARRDHSTGELRTKLRKRQFDRDLIEDVIDALESSGWVDDRAFARNQAEILERKGWGPIQIRAKLTKHGVEHGLASSTIEAMDADWLENAKERLRSKYTYPLTQEDRERGFRHLTYRGFPSDVARRAVFGD